MVPSTLSVERIATIKFEDKAPAYQKVPIQEIIYQETNNESVNQFISSLPSPTKSTNIRNRLSMGTNGFAELRAKRESLRYEPLAINSGSELFDMMNHVQPNTNRERGNYSVVPDERYRTNSKTGNDGYYENPMSMAPVRKEESKVNSRISDKYYDNPMEIIKNNKLRSDVSSIPTNNRIVVRRRAKIVIPERTMSQTQGSQLESGSDTKGERKPFSHILTPKIPQRTSSNVSMNFSEPIRSPKVTEIEKPFVSKQLTNVAVNYVAEDSDISTNQKTNPKRPVSQSFSMPNSENSISSETRRKFKVPAREVSNSRVKNYKDNGRYREYEYRLKDPDNDVPLIKFQRPLPLPEIQGPKK